MGAVRSALIVYLCLPYTQQYGTGWKFGRPPHLCSHIARCRDDWYVHPLVATRRACCETCENWLPPPAPHWEAWRRATLYNYVCLPSVCACVRVECDLQFRCLPDCQLQYSRDFDPKRAVRHMQKSDATPSPHATLGRLGDGRVSVCVECDRSSSA